MVRLNALTLSVAVLMLATALAAGPALARHKPKAAHVGRTHAKAHAGAHGRTGRAGGGGDAADDTPPPMEAPPSAPVYGGLRSLSETEARSRLGAPDIARNEGAGAMWTYRLADCALFVFFRAPGGQPLKVSGASSGPRSRGQTPIPVESCIAEGLAQRRGGG